MTVDLLTPFTKVEIKLKTDAHKHGIGLFWGAFNPVHVAHLTIADQVRQQLHLDTVRFLPENPSEAVLEMLRLATDGKPNLEVEEARCSASCGIYESVETLKKKFPDTDLYFIIGGDMVSSLSRWPRIDELLELITFVGVQRPRYRAGTSYPILWVDCPQMDVSSTQIREQIAKGITPNFLVAPQVLAYIKKEGLYKKNV
ncbi:MAG: nicotinate-nucleotide adenylyltransferase [Streptococcaceae bacterium]|jgi:nicotinate-nucleotide adenylyltransferase|nr:nicotinate-nucleotide adenylyltransferase [Streptococcaceae bacterium]